MDNNIVASSKFKEIIAEIIDLGFQKGALIDRNGITYQRRVDFNQGVDARILCKTPMYLKEISKICIKPLRIAFDHIGLKKPYEQSIYYAHDAGLNELSNYMLYNFHDTPEDLYQRMSLNIELNEKLGIRIFSFPMRYQPTDLKDRSHIGEHWSKYFLRSFQIILQATHGIVSGAPQFYKRAFGEDEQQFKNILIMPHDFIFNRTWFEEMGGMSELEQFKIDHRNLSQNDKHELLSFLSSTNPSQIKMELKGINNKKVKNILNYYIPLDKEASTTIWEAQKEKRGPEVKNAEHLIPKDELVEDANLEAVQ